MNDTLAGPDLTKGVAVDEYLDTNIPGIFALGDIARWPDRRTGERIRLGHTERWDEARLEGQLDAAMQDCTISYRRGNKTLAVAVVHRDLQGLNAEVAFENADSGQQPRRLLAPLAQQL